MHLSKIQHIIKFIEDNSNRNIDTKDLEIISNSSYRNLQRIFKSIFKEPIGAFQKRLKLENGYRKIIYTNTPISNIAIEVGFESIQSFSKAFKKKFQLSPLQARVNKTDLFNTFYNVSKNEAEKINCEFVYLKSKKIFFKTIQTNNYNNNDINLLWQKIDEQLIHSKNINYYGVIVDEPLITDRSKCRYEACIDIEPTAKDFYCKEIFGGKYAKFVHKGNYQNIEETYQLIYYDWLFNSSLEFDSSPIIEHYSISNHNEINESNYTTEILIPIKKK